MGVSPKYFEKRTFHSTVCSTHGEKEKNERNENSIGLEIKKKLVHLNSFTRKIHTPTLYKRGVSGKPKPAHIDFFHTLRNINDKKICTKNVLAFIANLADKKVKVEPSVIFVLTQPLYIQIKRINHF